MLPRVSGQKSRCGSMTDIVVSSHPPSLPSPQSSSGTLRLRCCSLTKRRLTGLEALRLERLPPIVYTQPNTQNGRLQLENTQHRRARPGILLQLRPRDPYPRRPARFHGRCPDAFRPDQAIDASGPGGGGFERSTGEPAIWRRRVRKGKAGYNTSRVFVAGDGARSTTSNERLLRIFWSYRTSTSAQSPRSCSQYGNRK